MLRIMPVLKLVSSIRLSMSLPCSVYYSRLFLVRPEIVHLKVLQKYMHGNGIWQVVTHIHRDQGRQLVVVQFGQGPQSEHRISFSLQCTYVHNAVRSQSSITCILYVDDV